MPFLLNKHNQKIAYKKISGKKPGIIFIHGLQSDMKGEKAIKIERFAIKNQHAFIRFDCRGHGDSFGDFQNFCISDWKQDLIDIIDKQTNGRQILVGSSMGGWLMMLAARARIKRISGLLGIAAAPDFTADIYNSFTKKNKSEIKNKGLTTIGTREYSERNIITKKLINDGKKNQILKKTFKLNKPMILVHGMKDDVVPISTPFKIMNKVSGSNIQIKLVKGSGHRLSSWYDINIILKSLSELLNI